jgi:uncharacterized protein with von Willebrand factor type A (vWA) domain
MDLFPEGWLDGGLDKKRLAKLSKHVVDNDRWDREDVRNMLKELPPFSAARKQLGEFAPTGEEFAVDAFWALHKAEPELLPTDAIHPDDLVNRRIAEMMAELDAYDRLRRYSVNDDVQAALSVVTMEPDIETLFDKTKMQREKAEQLRQALQSLAQSQKDLEERQRDLDDLIREWGGDPADPELQGEKPEQPEQGDGDGDDGEQQGDGEGMEGENLPGGTPQPGDGDGDGQPQPGQPGGSPQNKQGNQEVPGSGMDALSEEQWEQLAEAQQKRDEARERAEQAQQEAEGAGQEFEDSMDKGQGTVRSILTDALNKAADEAQSASDIARTWGLEPGEMQKMPAKERMELAKRLNNERFRRIADLFGPMRNLMLSEQQRKTVHTKEELFDVEIGGDIGRLLPTEILNLRAGPTRLDFLRRLSENRVLQYAMQGMERLARGGIIMSEDGSGSMGGDREIWAKAVMLCLLHLARIQKRSFHLIHFGSPGQFKLISFEKPEDFTLDRVLDAAELFFGGGTDFETPMKVCLDLLHKEFAATGCVRGDHVFVTDDECRVRDEFMEEYLGEAEKMQFTTWGISVSGGERRKGALDTMTEGKVATIKSFLSGEDIRNIFRGV